MSGDLPTVVVVSKDRHERLLRTVNYYVALGLTVVAVDGSPTQCAALSSLPRVRTLHQPGTPYWDRLALGLTGVETDTVVLAPDDDVMCLPALEACADLLARDPTVARACGTAVHVCQYRKDLAYSFADLPAERILDLPPSRDPLHRFGETLRIWPQAFYSVTRTQVARQVVAVLVTLPDSLQALGEHLWVAMPALSGSFAIIPRLQSLRSIDRPDYARFSAALKGVSSLRGWEPFAGVAEGMRAHARDIGLTAAADQEQVVELFDRYRLAPAKTPLGMLSERTTRTLGWARYVTHPRAFTDRRERGIFNGVRERSAARLGSYPWKCEIARREFAAAVVHLA